MNRISASGQDAATTIITVEEQLRGWLAEIHRLTDPHRQIVAYGRLQHRINFFAAWTVLPWDADAADLFVRSRREGVRIGSMDLKIACIALAHDATVLTRNATDFAQVPGLRIENWLDRPMPPLLFGMRSIAGTITGSSIDAEDSFPSDLCKHPPDD